MALRFAWDPQKDEANQRKHGIDFQEASTAFEDEAALLWMIRNTRPVRKSVYCCSG